MTENASTHHEKQLQEARQFWDEQASDFDNEPDHGLRNLETRAAWRQHLQNWLPGSHMSVLDLGCGTGSLSVIMAQLGHQVIGIDISPAMIALANSKAAIADAAIEFRVMDAAFPQFVPHSFDAIVCRHLLWALSEPHAVLERWLALIKPHGFFVFVEGFWHTGGGLKAQVLLQTMPAVAANVQVQYLDAESILWGGSVQDERYAVIGQVAG